MISASAEDSFPANASVDKLVESPGFHPGVLPVQVRPEVPMVGCRRVAKAADCKSATLETT